MCRSNHTGHNLAKDVIKGIKDVTSVFLSAVAPIFTLSRPHSLPPIHLVHGVVCMLGVERIIGR